MNRHPVEPRGSRPRASSGGGLRALLDGLGRLLLGAALAVAGAVFLISTVIAGVLAVFAVFVWALLSGRGRIAVQIGRQAWRQRSQARRAAQASWRARAQRRTRRPDPDDVVDVEHRDLP